MVYAIFSGEYSDWVVHGYFTDPEEAYAYCFKENQKRRDEFESEYYVVSIREINSDVSDVPKLYYKFCLHFWSAAGSSEWICSCDEDLVDVATTKTNTEIHLDRRAYAGRAVGASVCLDEYNPEKAKKIALDMLYKHLAQEQLEPEQA